MVGRTDELEMLNEALERTLNGSGQVVAISGEPGIGKTLLLSHLKQEALRQGFEVVSTTSTSLPGSPPLWPWREDLSQLDASQGLLDSFDQQLSGEGESPATEDTDSRRFRLFASIVDSLRTAAVKKPLMIAIDDMHWADTTSQDFFVFAASQLSRQSILLTTCLRTGDNEVPAETRRMLMTASRLPHFVRIEPKVLNANQVHELVESAIHHTVTRSVTRQIAIRSRGFPLFVRELSRKVGERGQNLSGELPEGIGELLGSQFDRLSPATQAVLHGAAVLGPSFKPAQVVDILNQGEQSVDRQITIESLLTSIDEASTAGIVQATATAAAAFEFSHPMYSEVARDRLPVGKRARMHATAATLLEDSLGIDAAGRSSELAWHFKEASPVVGNEKMVHYSLIAGQSALRSFAYSEALNHFENVRFALRDQPNHINFAHAWLGIARARYTYESKWGSSLSAAEISVGLSIAFQIFLDHGETELAIETASQGIVGEPGWAPNPRLTERALEIAGDDSKGFSRLLTRHADTLFSDLSRRAESDSVFARAFDLATRQNDVQLQLRILRIQAQFHVIEQNYEAAREITNRGLIFEDTTPLTSDLALIHINAGIAEASLGDTVYGEKRLMMGHSIAENLGVEMSKYHIAMANLALKKADFAEMLHFGRELERLEDAPVVILYEVINEMYSGDISTALAMCRRGAEGVPNIPPTFHLLAIYATLLAMMGRELNDESAITEAQNIASRIEVGAGTDAEGRSSARHGYLEAARAIIQGDPVSARKIYDKYLRLSGTYDLINAGPIFDLVLGQLAAVFHETETALEHFPKALEFAKNGGLILDECEIRREYASALIERGVRVDIARARDLLETGIALSDKHNLVFFSKRMTQLLASATQGRVVYPAGLTKREVEVVQLVADGKSNPEIAEELFISLNTVIRHMSHIFEKLGVSSRTEAALEAVHLGVVVQR
ncbi:MAG: DUF2791 family P-loop domain-containing protein [Chloroflexi bacterium]|nr:DUF2791 family P-loop domain-containing protein [Chloroflexota bacterium]